MKPIIGITSSYTKDDKTQFDLGNGTLGQEFNMLASDYVTAVVKAGGIPLLIPVIDDLDVVKEMLDRVDGLFISGGNDVEPMLYGGRADSKTGLISEERDRLEKFAAKYFIEETDKPYLGICRGLQIMNVSMGGTLHLDLESSGFLAHSLANNERYRPVHSAKIEKDSRVYDIFGKEEIMINSFHHQAADKVAEGFKASVMSDDGVIEAIELDGDRDRFVLAVQWHPEMMAVKDDEQQKVINAFVESCK